LELAVVVVVTDAVAAAHLFLQCNIARWSFPWARSSGCHSFDTPWWFNSTKYSSSISAGFWSHGAHVVWFNILDAILDLLPMLSQIEREIISNELNSLNLVEFIPSVNHMDNFSIFLGIIWIYDTDGQPQSYELTCWLEYQVSVKEKANTHVRFSGDLFFSILWF
jgi:hypothetical protein